MAISYDSADVLADFAKRKNITFTLLSDADSKTIDAYGLRDKDGKGYALPGTVIVDKDGLVREKLFKDGYKTRHSTGELIEAAKKLK